MNYGALIEAVLIGGVCLWQYPSLYSFVILFKNRMLARRNLKQYTGADMYRNLSPFEKYIGRLIDGAGASKYFSKPADFFIISAFLALAGFFIPVMVTDAGISFICGIFTGSIPFGILTAGLHRNRIAGSREGGILVREILNNYKIHSYNMKEAVEVTASEIENAPHAKKVMLDLAKGLNYAVTEPEVREVLEDFRFSFNTTWADIFSVDVFFAHMHGTRVDYALEDLLESMVRSRKLSEHEKQENNEARLMLKFLAPASYILSAVCACRYFDFTPAKFIRYQFMTSTGLKWFILMAIFYCGGLLVNGLLSRTKMDI